MKWNDIEFSAENDSFLRTSPPDAYVIPMGDKLAMVKMSFLPIGSFPLLGETARHIIGVKNDAEGAGPAHRLRHTFRTTLAELGAPGDQARLLMGHSMAGDVSRDYITAPLIIESLKPIVNAVAEQYVKIATLD